MTSVAGIANELKKLNVQMAQQQLEKAKKVMPAATAKQAAGNANS